MNPKNICFSTCVTLITMFLPLQIISTIIKLSIFENPTLNPKKIFFVDRVRKIPPPQFGGLLNAFSATMDEGEEINGLNGGSPMQMNGVNGGNQEEMNGMSSINGLQIMNTFSLSKEKSNGFSNEKVTSQTPVLLLCCESQDQAFGGHTLQFQKL